MLSTHAPTSLLSGASSHTLPSLPPSHSNHSRSNPQLSQTTKAAGPSAVPNNPASYLSNSTNTSRSDSFSQAPSALPSAPTKLAGTGSLYPASSSVVLSVTPSPVSSTPLVTPVPTSLTVGGLKARVDAAQQMSRLLSNPTSLPSLAVSILSDLLDEVATEVVFEEHRQAKLNPSSYSSSDTPMPSTPATGLSPLPLPSSSTPVPTDAANPSSVPPLGPAAPVARLDVFGKAKYPTDRSFKCENCSRLVTVTRFAPHLEKCMNMGRTPQRGRAARHKRTASQDAWAGSKPKAASNPSPTPGSGPIDFTGGDIPNQLGAGAGSSMSLLSDSLDPDVAAFIDEDEEVSDEDDDSDFELSGTKKKKKVKRRKTLGSAAGAKPVKKKLLS